MCRALYKSSLQVNYLIFVTKCEGTVVDLPLTVMWIRAFRTMPGTKQGYSEYGINFIISSSRHGNEGLERLWKLPEFSGI